VLDLIVHTRDLALYDDAAKVVFGLWRHVVVSFPQELALLAAGAWLRVRAIPFTRAGRYSLWEFAALLAALQVYANFGLPPSSSGPWLSLRSVFMCCCNAGGAGGAREYGGDIGESQLTRAEHIGGVEIGLGFEGLFGTFAFSFSAIARRPTYRLR
jgi:hypothetical protein